MSEQDELEYEKELAGYMADMNPANRETFLENAKKYYADFFAERFRNPTQQQIADHALFTKQSILNQAKMCAIFWKKMVEVKSRNLRKDELIHQLVIAEIRYEDKAHEAFRWVALLDNVSTAMHEVLGMDFKPGTATDPRFLGGGRVIKGHVEQQKAVMNQIVEIAKPVMGKLKAIKDGYKQRDAHKDRLHVIEIVQKIHEPHETIKSIINAPELKPYRRLYEDATLRKWIKEAIPQRKFAAGAPKKPK